METHWVKFDATEKSSISGVQNETKKAVPPFHKNVDLGSL